jgi:hypothetical protein
MMSIAPFGDQVELTDPVFPRCDTMTILGISISASFGSSSCPWIEDEAELSVGICDLGATLNMCIARLVALKRKDFQIPHVIAPSSTVRCVVAAFLMPTC